MTLTLTGRDTGLLGKSSELSWAPSTLHCTVHSVHGGKPEHCTPGHCSLLTHSPEHSYWAIATSSSTIHSSDSAFHNYSQESRHIQEAQSVETDHRQEPWHDTFKFSLTDLRLQDNLWLWNCESTACNFKMDIGKTNKINHYAEIFYHPKANTANLKCNISNLKNLKINITLLHLPCSWPLHYSKQHTYDNIESMD